MIGTYTTRQDAFEQVIIPALGEFVGDYDLDAIFDATFTYDPALGHIQDAGFVQTATADQFWTAVQNADTTDTTRERQQ